MSAEWPHNDFPFRVLPLQYVKTTAQRQSQSIKKVCAAQAQNRDLNFFGLKTNAEVLTHRWLCFQ